MKTLLTLPKWLGPLLTFIAIALNQALIELDVWPVQVAWLNLPLALAATTGMRSGLVSAALVGLYSIWLDPASVQRTVVVPLSVMALAALVGWQTRALRVALAEARAEHTRAEIALAEIEVKRSWAEALAKKLEIALEEARAGSAAVKALTALNGNIARIKEAKEAVSGVLKYDLLTDGTKDKLQTVVHTLNNLIIATEGWVQLEEIKARLAKKTKPMEGHADGLE